MRIVLTMAGVALGFAIAVVAGVYGWQQYTASIPLTSPVKIAQTTSDAPKPPLAKPKPVTVPATAPQSPKPTAAPPATPKDAAPAPLPAQDTRMPQRPTAPPVSPTTAPTPGQQPVPPSAAPTPGEDTPIAVPEASNVVTADKLEQLVMGITEDDAELAMGRKGVATAENELPVFTPEGWYEVRWPNPDGSYIAALFSDQQTLVYAEPFGLAGADGWMATPWFAVPDWLNDKLQANNMPVRLPAVEVIEAQVDVFQFRGPLANAEGQILGSVSGTYYVNDPSGRFARAMEGSYEYARQDGSVDSNTFSFTE